MKAEQVGYDHDVETLACDIYARSLDNREIGPCFGRRACEKLAERAIAAAHAFYDVWHRAPEDRDPPEPPELPEGL